MIITMSLKYFLLVASELNISRAAEKAFISHQSMSAHMKRLEQDLGVCLFHRYPVLSLTDEGIALQRAAHEIEFIEQNLMNEFSDNNANFTGTFHLGVPQSRYESLVPPLLECLKKEFPSANIEIISDVSVKLNQHILDNEIDMAISAYSEENSNLENEFLYKDSFSLIISNKLLQKYFPDSYPDCISDFYENGIDLLNCKHIPLILPPKDTILYSHIHSFFSTNDSSFKLGFLTNNFDILPALCSSGIGAGIISHTYNPLLLKYNATCQRENYIYSFPLSSNCAFSQNIELIYRKNKYFSKYYLLFMKVIKGFFSNTKY